MRILVTLLTFSLHKMPTGRSIALFVCTNLETISSLLPPFFMNYHSILFLHLLLSFLLSPQEQSLTFCFLFYHVPSKFSSLARKYLLPLICSELPHYSLIDPCHSPNFLDIRISKTLSILFLFVFSTDHIFHS